MDRFISFMRGLEQWRESVRLHRYRHAPPRSVMAGWAGSDPAEGRTPEAECQWWADRLGNRQAEGGSAGAKVVLLP